MTYVGTYGGNERVPVDRLLHREGHPLGVRREELGSRRDEVTAIAAAEAEEAATSSKKWTFGVAAGALLMAGTFAAGALGITGGAVPLANTAPEHAPAAPGHVPNGGPAVGAPAPGQDNKQQPQQDPRLQQTEPSAAAPNGGVTSDRDLSSPTGNGERSGGGSGDSTSTPAPQPAPTPQPQPAPQPAPQQQQQGPLGQVLTPVVDTADDILSPVTDIVGGLLSPRSADTSSAQGAATPSGPALTMINPLGDLLGG